MKPYRDTQLLFYGDVSMDAAGNVMRGSSQCQASCTPALVVCSRTATRVFAARRYASAALAVMQCLSVRHVRGLCQDEQTYLQNFFTVG